MPSLIIEGVLIGVILAYSFRFYILIPVSAFATCLIFTNPLQMEPNLSRLCIDALVLTSMLLLGYVLGLALFAPEGEQRQVNGSHSIRPGRRGIAEEGPNA